MWTHYEWSQAVSGFNSIVFPTSLWVCEFALGEEGCDVLDASPGIIGAMDYADGIKDVVSRGYLRHIPGFQVCRCIV